MFVSVNDSVLILGMVGLFASFTSSAFEVAVEAREVDGRLNEFTLL